MPSLRGEGSIRCIKCLAGMSVENLLKAIMVRDEPCLVGKYKISDEIKSHNVWSEYGDTSKRDKPVKFLNGSEVATGGRLQSVISEDGTEQSIKDVLEEDEQEFLRIVEAYVAWIGRFPSAQRTRLHERSRRRQKLKTCQIIA